MAKHERADIDPSAVTSTELREAIGFAGPMLRGDLLSAYGELNALHAPIAVGSDGAPAARDRLGTAVVPHQTVARRHR